MFIAKWLFADTHSCTETKFHQYGYVERTTLKCWIFIQFSVSLSLQEDSFVYAQTSEA